jgi:hypothetical protein
MGQSGASDSSFDGQGFSAKAALMSEFAEKIKRGVSFA